MGKTGKITIFLLSVATAGLIYQASLSVSYEASYNVDQSTFIKFISDPNNFKLLNPTILELTVTSRNDEDINIEYTEHLVQLSFIFNYATATYKVNDKGPIWRLESQHETCFLSQVFCLPTNSTVYVRASSIDTVHYKEEINYTCPWILTTFCSLEVHLQRRLIMDNLDRMFKENKRHE